MRSRKAFFGFVVVYFSALQSCARKLLLGANRVLLHCFVFSFFYEKWKEKISLKNKFCLLLVRCFDILISFFSYVAQICLGGSLICFDNFGVG